MRIKSKMIIGAALLSAIPVIIASLTIGSLASNESHDALGDAAKERLVALRDVKKEQISDYVKTIESQILNLSRSHEVENAMEGFSHSAGSLHEQLGQPDIEKYRSELANYYRSEFQAEYGRRNSGEQTNVDQLLNALDADAVALQYQYIKANPNPLGQKDALIEPSDSSDYGRLHAEIHPYFRDFQQRFGYYDVFLVDADSGRIVYSVFKELDFATSLKSGAYANSGIGKVFQAASQASSPDFVTFSDFSPYTPSYQDHAAFMASPIYKGSNKIGVLIFQMPIDRINDVMTMNGKWKEAGLGDSGETYLIGPDTRARSISRFLLEDKEGYLQAISEGGVDQRTVDLIKAKETSIGLHAIDTEGSRAALKGETGFAVFPDYRDVPVLSAYAPIEIGGKKLGHSG